MCTRTARFDNSGLKQITIIVIAAMAGVARLARAIASSLHRDE